MVRGKGVCFFMCLCASMITPKAVVAREELRLDMTCQVSEVYLGEPVQFLISLRNTSESEVVVPITWSQRRFEIWIEHDGEIRGMNPFLTPTTMVEEQAHIVAPGETYDVQARMLERGYFNEPGRYRCIAVFSSNGQYRKGNRTTGQSYWAACWKGDIASDLLVLTVRTPTAPQDVAALKILLSGRGAAAYDRIFLGINDVLSGKDDRFARVIELYPDSVYAKHCEYYLGMINASSFLTGGRAYYFEVARSHFEQLQKREPFDFTDDAQLLFARCLIKKGQRERGGALLVELLGAHPGPDTAHHARSFLIYLAAYNGQIDGVEELIAKGADVNVADSRGATPLHVAAQQGHEHMVELLLAKGANVHARARARRTPLHYAAQHGHMNVARLLLASGADVNAKGVGRTPMQLAAEGGHKEVVQLLKEHGAKE